MFVRSYVISFSLGTKNFFLSITSRTAETYSTLRGILRILTRHAISCIIDLKNRRIIRGKTKLNG